MLWPENLHSNSHSHGEHHWNPCHTQNFLDFTIS